MNFKEDMNHLITTQPTLTWVRAFLEAFPDVQLYLVGGAVRDLIMGRLTPPSIPPSAFAIPLRQGFEGQDATADKRGGGRNEGIDFDFVVRGLEADTLESWFAPRGEINLVGKTFGVFRFMPEGMDPSRTPFVDIALPRTEQAHAQTKGGYREFNVQSDANLPIEEDLARRDFTINAMAINMRTGELVDPYNGQEDIRRRTIRAVGDPQKRFDEDLSRMLRAIRFATELHFVIEDKTLAAIKKNIERINDVQNPPLSPLEKGGKASYLPLQPPRCGGCEGVQEQSFVVPRETVGSELAKALATHPAGAVKWLMKTGGMETLFQTAGSEDHAFDDLSQNNPTLATALLLRAHDRAQVPFLLAKTGLDSLPRGTPLRIEPTDVLWLLDRLSEFWNETTVMELRASTFEKYFMNGRGALFQQALATIGEGTTLKAARDRARAIRDRWSVEEGEPIPPLVSGNDVIEAGVPAGPKVRETLEILRDQQLEGKILTREQAKRWLKDKSSSDGVKE